MIETIGSYMLLLIVAANVTVFLLYLLVLFVNYIMYQHEDDDPVIEDE